VYDGSAVAPDAKKVPEYDWACAQVQAARKAKKQPDKRHLKLIADHEAAKRAEADAAAAITKAEKREAVKDELRGTPLQGLLDAADCADAMAFARRHGPPRVPVGWTPRAQRPARK